MKTLKRIFSGILALTLCTGMTSLTVGAIGNSYYKGDVNNDGRISSSDLVAMVSFFNGQKSASGSDAERLDLNRDYIINNTDFQLLESILLEDIDSELVTSVNETALPSETSVQYRIYDPELGTVKRTYTVYPNTSTVSNSTNNRGLIYGEDSRVIQNGMRGVLNVQTSTGVNKGTAFVVDSHTILTAGHVLYDYKTHTLKRNLKFKVFDPYNTVTDVVITPKSYHIPLEFCESGTLGSDGNYSYVPHMDYGIVTVEEDLSDYINFDIGIIRNGNMNQTINVTGFGGIGNNNIDQGLVNSDFVDVKTTGSGYLMEDTPYYDNFIYYDTDTVGGYSGGPVWVDNIATGTKTVIGINIFEVGNSTQNSYNAGFRINTNILHAIFNNEYYLSL